MNPNVRPSTRLRWAISLIASAALLGVAFAQTKPDGAAADASKAGKPEAGAKAGPGAAPGGAPGGRSKMPPPAVSVVKVKLQDLPRTLSATAHAVPLQSVDVRAQVSALVDKVHVQEGQTVKAGQLLFTLDSRTARAELVKAQATLARSQANLLELQRQLKRSQTLQSQNFVSSSATDTLAAQVAAQQAQVDADAAAMRAQDLRVSLYRITAPISGRVGSVDVFPGTLVGTASLLTITQMQPMGVQFALPQSALAAVQRAGVGATVKVQSTQVGSAPMSGRLRFIDSRVDPNTSMLTLKAEVDNAQMALWPGTTLSVSLETQALQQVAVVPQAAVMLRNDRPIVWVVGEDNKTSPRPVQSLDTLGERVAVHGLKDGERVVVDGRQFVRPGAAVRIVGQAQE